MRKSTKRQLSTAVGCVIGGVLFPIAPLVGHKTAEWQRKQGLS